MAGRHEFEDATAIHLGLDIHEFYRFDKKAKEVFCRDYMKLLIREHGTAKDISAAIGISLRGVYAIVKRYGLKLPRYYPAKSTAREG